MHLNNGLVAKLLKYLEEGDSIFLDEPYLKNLIDSGIAKAGSMRQLGKILGYSGFSKSWSIKQIRDGKQGILYRRLSKLAEFLNMKPEIILKHTLHIYSWQRRRLSPKEFLKQRTKRS